MPKPPKRPDLKLVRPSSFAPIAVDNHDEATEAALLACAASGNAEGIAALRLTQSSDFWSGANRDIRDHILMLDEDGKPVDVTTLAAALHAADKLARIGGVSALAKLIESTPAIAHPRAYAKILAADGERRRIIEWSLRLAHEGKQPGTAATEFIATARQACGRMADATSAFTEWPTTREMVAQLGDARPRIETGFPTLDEATRGGLRLGSTTVIGGAPSTFKTAFVNGLAVRLARKGVHVALVTADEPREDTLVRLGQLFGFARAELESGVPEARAAFADAVSRVALHVVDPEDTGATLEDVSVRLRRSANGAPSALIVDSVQTCPAVGTVDAENYRERVDLVVKAAKRAAKRDGHMVVMTSELARGAYASKKAADRTSDLAAFKESGSVEYAAHVLIVLRTLSEGLVIATNPKNRLGRRFDAMAMRFDFERATLSECEIPHDDSDDSIEDLVLALLRDRTDLREKDAIAKLIGRKAADVRPVVDALVTDRRIAKVGGAYRLSPPVGET